jgi:malate dehydrogenase (oxaloacetate-decarboxylating)
VSKNIAVAVVKSAVNEGVARIDPEKDVEELVNRNMWKPVYIPYREMKRSEASK